MAGSTNQDGGQSNANVNNISVEQNANIPQGVNTDVKSADETPMEEAKDLTLTSQQLDNKNGVNNIQSHNMDVDSSDRNNSLRSPSHGADMRKPNFKHDQPRKSKRGRKRKHRDPNEGSTDSDPDLFNYDKFLKKVSKKGTRVHMNVRSFAVRTVVHGSKVLMTSNSKMSMGSKSNANPAVVNSKAQKSQQKFEEVPLDPVIEPPVEQHQAEEPKESLSEKKPVGDYLHAGEDFYNVDGYELGRYNLRRRAKQKKYYDEEAEIDREEVDQNIKYGYAKEYKQGPRGGTRNPNYGISSMRDSAQHGKSKRRKKDDDEDYIEEDDYEEPEYDNQEKRFNENKRSNQTQNNFPPSGNMSQFPFMQQNPMGNQFGMNPMGSQFGMNPQFQQMSKSS